MGKEPRWDLAWPCSPITAGTRVAPAFHIQEYILLAVALPFGTFQAEFPRGGRACFLIAGVEMVPLSVSLLCVRAPQWWLRGGWDDGAVVARTGGPLRGSATDALGWAAHFSLI